MRSTASKIATRSAAARIKILGGVFWAEDALEARAGELHADEAFALRGRIHNMDNTAGSCEVRFAAARGVVRKRNPDLQIRADGDVEPRQKRGTAAA